MPRAVCIDGVYSRLIGATRSIAAGSGTATAELRILVLSLLDALEIKAPSVAAAIYVDDINLEIRKQLPASVTANFVDNLPQAAGSNRKSAQRHVQQLAAQRFAAAAQAARDLADTTNCAVEFFENQLGMSISTTKSLVLGGTPALSRLIAALVPGGKIKALRTDKEETGEMLGVSTCGG